MIIATMVELAQRILMKRPTVALTSETAIRLAASRPTRASDPRTEITRPKDVTVVKPVICRARADTPYVNLNYAECGWTNG